MYLVKTSNHILYICESKIHKLGITWYNQIIEGMGTSIFLHFETNKKI